MNCIETRNPVSPSTCPSRPGPSTDEVDPSLFGSSTLDDLVTNMQEKLALLDDPEQTPINKNKPIHKKGKVSKSTGVDTTKMQRHKPSQSKTRRGGTKRGRKGGTPAVDVTPPVTRSPPKKTALSYSSDASVSSIDSDDPTPAKRKIDLRPHRSVDLYNAQRQDETLRTALRENPRDFTVRQVHGHKLVFKRSDNDDDVDDGAPPRVYIPESLQQITWDYYFNKYQLHPITRMREACWWPTMEKQQRRRHKWCVRLQDPGDKSTERLVYDSDDDETAFAPIPWKRNK